MFILNLSVRVAGKAWVPKKRVDPIIESVTLEPELEEALASASDAELCDIAGNAIIPSSHLITCMIRIRPISFSFSLKFVPNLHNFFSQNCISLNCFYRGFCGSALIISSTLRIRIVLHLWSTISEEIFIFTDSHTLR